MVFRLFLKGDTGESLLVNCRVMNQMFGHMTSVAIGSLSVQAHIITSDSGTVGIGGQCFPVFGLTWSKSDTPTQEGCVAAPTAS